MERIVIRQKEEEHPSVIKLKPQALKIQRLLYKEGRVFAN